jgi:phosphopantetheinyl transferase
MSSSHERDHLLGILAAQRAVAHCIEDAFGEKISAHEVQIVPHKLAKPRIRLAPIGLSQKKAARMAEGIDFSISHSKGLAVAQAIRRDQGRVGVDIEAIRTFALPTARAFLTKSEYHTVSHVPPAEQAYLMTLFWCMKEAYLKACGVGLLVHPSRVDVLSLFRGAPYVTHDDKRVPATVRWALYRRFIITHVLLPHG